MQISGIQKLTLTDYPGHVACIIFTQGCNFRCPFCQNSSLLSKRSGLLDNDEVFTYIEKRKDILDGVVISGGEPTLQCNLILFIKKIKKLGLNVKLDTNGYQYDVLKYLIENKLIDYIAMDIKDDLSYYEKITGVNKIDVNILMNSVELIKNSGIKHEFRTTIVKEFHDDKKISNICNLVGSSNYFLQNYEDSGMILKKGLHGFTDEELLEISLKFPNLKVRGI